MGNIDLAGESYDDIILGGGKGGKSLALALAANGHRVALIERGMIGGSCINVACIPTKTMVAASKMLEAARAAAPGGFKIAVSEPNLAATLKRKRRVVEGMVNTHWDLFTKTPNLDFYFGSGAFVDAQTIEIKLNDGGTKVIQGRRKYINTGSRPLIPDYPGLQHCGYLTSTSIMELADLPRHLAIIGGGYIALEFAQIFHRLGSKVTLLERSGPDHFLPREEKEIAAAARAILEEEGIEILFNTQIIEVSGGPGATRVKVVQKNAAESADQHLEFSHILAATGRLPNTEDLGLEKCGIKLDSRSFILVNEKLETSAENIYAIGDCKGAPFFTHLSWDDYRILKDNVLYNSGRTTNGRLVPYTLFIDPELGRVGLTEEEARKQGKNVLVAQMPANKIPRALTEGESRGLLKAVVDADSKQILGASLLCHGGGEIIAAIQVAMLSNMPYTNLRDVIFSHPTMSEAINILFAGLPR